jgi:hypothetical protein
MMNIYEIYVINRALDGNDIFTLPSFSKLNISNFMIDDIKNVLIKKQILENNSTFTKTGISLTNRLRMFKQAEKHIQIGNIALGVLDKNESILLHYNPLLKEYEIEIMDSTDLADQMTSFYSFLKPDSTADTVPVEEVRMTTQEFNEAFTLDEDSHFRMLIQDKDKKRDEIYFISDGKYYVYDMISYILNSLSHSKLMSLLKERMRI